MERYEPLLQAFWENLKPTEAEAGPQLPPCLSAAELQQQYPNQVIQYLKVNGVRKLGDARILATDLPPLFGNANLLTRGSTSTSFDWETDWGLHPLGDAPASPDDGSDSRGYAVPQDQEAGAASDRGESGGLRDYDSSGRRRWGQVRSLLQRGSLKPEPSHSFNLRHTSAAGGLARGSVGLERRSLAAASVPSWSSALLPLVPRHSLLPAPRQRQLRPPASAAAPAPLPPPPSVVVEAYLVSVRDAAAPGERGLLRSLLLRWQLGSCSPSVFGLPAVQAVVSYKWERFARRLLLQQLAAYGLWLGAFTGFMLLFNSSDAALPVRQLMSTWKGRAAMACEALALLGMLPFAAAEVCVLFAYGFLAWLSAWNLLDCSTYGLQIAISVLHLGIFHNGPAWLMMAVAVQAILLVVRLTFFSRVFRSTTFDFMGSLQAVAMEVGWYVAVLLLLIWGFACAFYTLFRGDDGVDSFGSLPVSMLTVLNYAVGGTSYYMRDLLSSRYPAAAVVLCLVYQFVVSMLLMSLLTGVMANVLMQTTRQEEINLMLSRAQVIDELETVLPPALVALLTGYGTCGRSRDNSGGGCGLSADGGSGQRPLWMPYVHVLRVNPHSLERFDKDEQLWPAGFGDESNGAGGPGVGGGGVGAAFAPSTGNDKNTRVGAATGEAPPSAVAAATASTVGRMEAQVRQLESQLAELRGVVRQLLDLRNDVRQIVQQQQQFVEPMAAAPTSGVA